MEKSEPIGMIPSGASSTTAGISLATEETTTASSEDGVKTAFKIEGV